jgi:D-arabinose 1-dehydrogenase-like Zn-dependent alcohol dehydrogenase
MDSQKNKSVNRVLATTGQGEFVETEYNVPPLTPDEICVRAVMTGVCRSDIDMMQGNFGPLPLHMQGHEGLGRVIGIGANVNNVKIGDCVATRGEPAYADVYNVRNREYVVVPEAHPRYILEPVACGINIVHQPLREIAERSGPGRRLLIIGTGFLAWVAYHTLRLNHIDIEITVQGRSNQSMWLNADVLLANEPKGKFDVIIDLGSNTDVFDLDIVKSEALIVFGAQKKVTTDFSNLLWKACTMMFPSPRTDKFYQCMKDAEYWITNGDLVVDRFWTKGYNRNTEWQQAFSDGVTRPAGYSRGYIYWNWN